MLHLNLIKEIKSFSKEIKANKKVNWKFLSKNVAAIHLLEKNLDKVSWWNFSYNASAVPILLKNMDKVEALMSVNPSILREKYFDDSFLELNIKNCPEFAIRPAALHLVEKYIDRVDWRFLLQNPAALDLIRKNPNRINLHYLLQNPAIFNDEVVISSERTIIKSVSIDTEGDELLWLELSLNPAASDLLEKNLDKICWRKISRNPNVSDEDLEKVDKFFWEGLSENPSIIHLLED